MKLMTSILFVSIVFAQSALAGDCVLSITRKACPGKEDPAYKPYGDKVTSEEKKSADSEADCKAMAEKAAKIVRKGTLASKSVTANFEGKPAGEASDKADCQ